MSEMEYGSDEHLDGLSRDALKAEVRWWHERALEMEAENAKLRELVADMWFWSYCGHIDSESQEKQMAHIDSVLDRMRELGVEVDA